MAGFLDGLLRAAPAFAGLAAARQHAAAQRADMERAQMRQQIQDALQRRFVESEISKNLRPPGTNPFTFLKDPTTGAVTALNKTTGAGAAVPNVNAGASPVQLRPLTNAVTGDVSGYNPITNTVTATGASMGVRRKEPTPAERVAASQLGSVQASVDRMEDIASHNPGAVDEASAALQSRHIPLVGGAVQAGRNLFLSPDAQEFVGQFKNFQLAVTPTYGGARPTQQLLDLEEAASLPGIAAGGSARAAAFTHMRARIQDVQAKAGQAAPAVPRQHPKPRAVTAPPAARPEDFFHPND